MDRKKLIFTTFLVLTLLYAAGIFYLSSQSNPPGADEGEAITPYFSYLAHIALYFGFSLFVYQTLARYPEGLRMDVNMATFTIVLLYGLSDELHQTFVPRRTFSFFDIIMDALGCLLLLLVLTFLKKRSCPLLRNLIRAKDDH